MGIPALWSMDFCRSRLVDSPYRERGEGKARGRTKAERRGRQSQDGREEKEKDEREALAAHSSGSKNRRLMDSCHGHPSLSDFVGRKVEVGGFKPFLRLNPPPRKSRDLSKHVKFLEEISNALPRLSFVDTVITSEGIGVYRVRMTYTTSGFSPTRCQWEAPTAFHDP